MVSYNSDVNESLGRYPVRARGREADRLSLRRFMAYGSVVMAVAGVLIGTEYLSSQKPTGTVIEKARAYDTPWDIAKRAEQDAGANLAGIDLRPIADQIQAQYGSGFTKGEKIKVQVEKQSSA